MTATQRLPAVDSTVTFRPEFSAQLVGVEFIVEDRYPARGENPLDMVGLKIRRNGRWCRRLAYVNDLAV